MLLRAFGHDDPEFVLEYKAFFGWDSGGDILYIRRPTRTARHNGDTLAIERFGLVDVATRAAVVGWRVGIGDNVRATLVRHLQEASRPKPSKKKRKRTSVDVSPEDAGAGNENSAPRQPLVPVRDQSDSITNNKRLMIYCTLEGRADKMVVPNNGLLPMYQRDEGEPPPCPMYTDTDKARDMRHITCLHLASFGAVTVWVPAHSSLYGSNNLSRIKRESTGFCR